MIFIFYDGECLFCESWVRLVVKNSSVEKIRFVPMQLIEFENKQKLLTSKAPSMVVLDGSTRQIYLNAQASLFALRQTEGVLGWLAFFLSFAPEMMANLVYRVIGRNRHLIFGRKNHCEVPSDLERDYFITNKREFSAQIEKYEITFDEFEDLLSGKLNTTLSGLLNR
jgi:predicted DCC family thiol-disulfide oxidoreductase YuxK